MEIDVKSKCCVFMFSLKSNDKEGKEVRAAKGEDQAKALGSEKCHRRGDPE